MITSFMTLQNELVFCSNAEQAFNVNELIDIEGSAHIIAAIDVAANKRTIHISPRPVPESASDSFTCVLGAVRRYVDEYTKQARTLRTAPYDNWDAFDDAFAAAFRLIDAKARADNQAQLRKAIDNALTKSSFGPTKKATLRGLFKTACEAIEHTC